MNVEYKRPMRSKLIAIAALPVVLSAVFIFTRRERALEPLREDQAASPAQSARKNQGGRSDVSGRQLTAVQWAQIEPVERSSSGLAERFGDAIPMNSYLMHARLTHKVDPVYPEIAKSTRLSNAVRLNVTTNEQGAVTKAEVIEGHPVFAEAAVEAVRQWRYEPVLVNGKPTPASFSVIVNFAPNEIVHTGGVNVGRSDSNEVIIVSDNPFDKSVRTMPFSTLGNPRSYNDREYFPAMNDMYAPVIQIDKQRAREIVSEGLQRYDERLKDMVPPLRTMVYINENGNIDGIEQFVELQIPGIEKKLMDVIRVQSPAAWFNGDAVPSFFILIIDTHDILR